MNFKALMLPALLLAWLGAWQLSFLCDDAFITFRYVSNAHEGQGLVWNPAPFAPVPRCCPTARRCGWSTGPGRSGVWTPSPSTRGPDRRSALPSRFNATTQCNQGTPPSNATDRSTFKTTSIYEAECLQWPAMTP